MMTELPETDLLAGLRGQANALILNTDLLGEIAICQFGGDLTMTAYALLSDLVAVGRGQIADPDWPRKAQQGDWSAITLCTKCNTLCFGNLRQRQHRLPLRARCG